jgi:hypothetical protein
MRGCPSRPASANAAIACSRPSASISGVPPPMIHPAPYRAVRRNAASAEPPTMIGGGGSVFGPTSSPRQYRSMSASISSMRRPRSWIETPEAA